MLGSIESKKTTQDGLITVGAKVLTEEANQQKEEVYFIITQEEVIVSWHGCVRCGECLS